MKRREFLAGSVLTFATLGVWTSSPNPAGAGNRMAVIEGTFSWRERILPRPGTTAIVTLEDISRADGASVKLATVKIDMTGKSVPQKFALKVPADKFNKNMSYAVRVRVTDGRGKLRWTTDTVHPVDPSKASQNLGNLPLRKVR